MRLYAKCFLMTAVLAVPLMLCAQQDFRFSDPNLLARLSFDSGGSGFLGNGRICLAVDRDGSFRMMRTNAGLRMIRTLDPAEITKEDSRTIQTIRTLLDPTQRMEGTMPQEQLLQFEKLVGSSDLRPLAGNHFALIRQSAETFTAEIPVLDKQVSYGTLHVHILNADGQNPFPSPVRKLVDWLNRFEPLNAVRSADLEFRDVCPSGGLQFVQPLALNVP